MANGKHNAKFNQNSFIRVVLGLKAIERNIHYLDITQIAPKMATHVAVNEANYFTPFLLNIYQRL
jgi:hypothetical protein